MNDNDIVHVATFSKDGHAIYEIIFNVEQNEITLHVFHPQKLDTHDYGIILDRVQQHIKSIKENKNYGNN